MCWLFEPSIRSDTRNHRTTVSISAGAAVTQARSVRQGVCDGVGSMLAGADSVRASSLAWGDTVDIWAQGGSL